MRCETWVPLLHLPTVSAECAVVQNRLLGERFAGFVAYGGGEVVDRLLTCHQGLDLSVHDAIEVWPAAGPQGTFGHRVVVQAVDECLVVGRRREGQESIHSVVANAAGNVGAHGRNLTLDVCLG